MIVYVRLQTLFGGGGTSQFVDYTYTALGTTAQAVLTTPTPGSQLTSTAVRFSWTPGSGATQYQFRVGNGVGNNNYFNSGVVTTTSATVTGLPATPVKVYVRLSSYINQVWVYTDYTYTAM